jgi:hypothetical protein
MESITFTPTKWATAADKAKWFEKLKKFVASGMAPTRWNKPLYRQLSNMFGHIAHYNQGGFYAEWFNTPPDRARWIDHVLNWPCYGSPEYTWCDVEREVQSWLRDSGQIPRFQTAAQASIYTRETALLRALAAKYPEALSESRAVRPACPPQTPATEETELEEAA